MLLVKLLQGDKRIKTWIESLSDDLLVEEILKQFPEFFVREDIYWYTCYSEFSETGRAYAASAFTNKSSQINVRTGLPLMYDIPNILSQLTVYCRTDTDVAANAALTWYSMKYENDLGKALSQSMFSGIREGLELFLFIVLKDKQEEKAWPISP